MKITIGAVRRIIKEELGATNGFFEELKAVFDSVGMVKKSTPKSMVVQPTDRIEFTIRSSKGDAVSVNVFTNDSEDIGPDADVEAWDEEKLGRFDNPDDLRRSMLTYLKSVVRGVGGPRTGEWRDAFTKMQGVSFPISTKPKPAPAPAKKKPAGRDRKVRHDFEIYR